VFGSDNIFRVAILDDNGFAIFVMARYYAANFFYHGLSPGALVA